MVVSMTFITYVYYTHGSNVDDKPLIVVVCVIADK